VPCHDLWARPGWKRRAQLRRVQDPDERMN
jgi:hypothetical protein